MEVTSYEPGTPCWVDLGSPDPDAAADFYSGLFGWTVTDQGSEAGNYRLCSLHGKTVAGLGHQQQVSVPPYWTTYVSVSDATAAARTVAAAGGEVLLEPIDVMSLGRMAVFADPTGAPFSVWQPGTHIGAQLVDEPGTLCWNELTTRQTEQAKNFYQAVFGWQAATQDMGPTSYTEWQLGGRSVGGMMPMDDTWSADLPSHWLVYFAVEDADTAAARVAELGGRVSIPPTDIPPGRFTVVNDPHGAFFSIIALNRGGIQ